MVKNYTIQRDIVMFIKSLKVGLRHCAGFLVGLASFFGMIHGSIILGSFVIGVCCGVAIGPMFGIALAIGTVSALLETAWTMYKNIHRFAKEKENALAIQVEPLQALLNQITTREFMALLGMEQLKKFYEILKSNHLYQAHDWSAMIIQSYKAATTFINAQNNQENIILKDQLYRSAVIMPSLYSSNQSLIIDQALAKAKKTSMSDEIALNHFGREMILGLIRLYEEKIERQLLIQESQQYMNAFTSAKNTPLATSIINRMRVTNNINNIKRFSAQPTVHDLLKDQDSINLKDLFYKNKTIIFTTNFANYGFSYRYTNRRVVTA
jgi:hypothetical protein